MKKHVLLAMAVIMVLGTFKAMAQSEQEAMDMNQQSKVEAGIRNQQMESLVDQNTKIQGSQVALILEVERESEAVYKALIALNQTGALQRSGIGQISDIAEKNAAVAKDSFDSKEIDDLHSSSLDLQKDLNQIKSDFGLKIK